MKNKLFFISLILFFLSVKAVEAQYSKLYEFKLLNDAAQSTYSQPVYDGTWLYDVTPYGGKTESGVIYKIKPDGSGFTKLFDFDGIMGANPNGSLTLKNDSLYGMTNTGGVYNLGCIFKIRTDGTGYAKIYDFSDYFGGSSPLGGLTISGNVLYGVTELGGNHKVRGIIFKINTDGSGYKMLWDFASTPLIDPTSGCHPIGSLTLVNDTLYGMANGGGSSATGTQAYGLLFKIKTDGTGYTKLVDFRGENGANPFGSLMASGDTLFGVTSTGGSTGNGIIFKITTSGKFDTLASFSGNNGCRPDGALVLINGVLYGTTSGGNIVNSFYSGGSIFSIKTNGTQLTKIKQFSMSDIDGSTPMGSLTVVNDTLYGTTHAGGITGYGCIFKISKTGSVYKKISDLKYGINGSNPGNGIVFSKNHLYCVAENGGTGHGYVAKFNADGSGLLNLQSFIDGYSGYKGPLIQSNDTLYGMDKYGGSYNNGYIYKVKVDGSGFAEALNFPYSNGGAFNYPYGRYPNGGLCVSGNTLYGMTRQGGANDKGAIFKVNKNGTSPTNLHSFSGSSGLDGAYPGGSLIISGDTLFGVADSGGINNKGCIFRINKDGSGYSDILDFDGAAKGQHPQGSLTLYGTTLYGMTLYGGASGQGCIFKLNTNGQNFAKLLDFTGAGNGLGANGALIFKGGFLFGVTEYGGANNKGRFFKINPDGNNYKKLLDFDGVNNGANPIGYLAISGDTIFGSTVSGGVTNTGTIFSYIGSKSSPSLSWATPDSIWFGTSLTVSQLNANENSSLAGVFSYSPNAGTVLGVGVHQLKATFTPTDTSNYSIASITIQITVVPKIIPSITWGIPVDITYGTLLGNSNLNASANKPGLFTYNPTSGTKLNAGNHQVLKVHFTPADTISTTAMDDSVYINVLKADPIIKWSDPSIISYGTKLGSDQLNATANIDGTFTYLPGDSTLLSAGNAQKLKVNFTPTDSINYNKACDSVLIDVSLKKIPIITWNKPMPIIFGTLLDTTQLNASANVKGSITYTPGIGEKLKAGPWVLKARFIPEDTANYAEITKTVKIDVTKATPVITWDTISGIQYGTKLSSTQLNATANTGGTFYYSPAEGSILTVGNNQVLNVNFLPDDTLDFYNASKTDTINVLEINDISQIQNNLGWLIYPNPFNDCVNIENHQEYAIVSILDITGKSILEVKTQGQLKSSIHIGNLESGIYFFVIKDKTNKPLIIKKMVK